MKKSRFLFIVLFLLTLQCMSCFATGEADNPGYEFYFRQLDTNQQAIYRAILDAPAKTGSCTVVLPEQVSSEDVLEGKINTVLSLIGMDHPVSMAWLSWCRDIAYDAAANAAVIELVCSDFYDPRDQALSEMLIDTIAAAADSDWDLYTKALFTSNVVVDALDYDWKYVFYPENGKCDYYNSTILCVNNGYAICGGFSKLYKAIADRIGLPCVEVGSVGHAWVHVQMEDGNWYGVEPQDPLRLQGTSTMLNSVFMAPGVDQYELFDDFFGEGSGIHQPERTEYDYEYTGTVIDPGSVDLTQKRLENAASETIFSYTVNEDGATCTITGFTGKESGDLTIPASMDGYPVTGIGNSAFTYANFDGRLILPDSIEIIGNQAFAGCDRLTGQLVLPANLRTIKASAFIGCSGFTGEIVFNDKLERIDCAAIAGCSGLTGSLMLPDSLAVMQNDSIYDCPGLNGVLHIPSGISSWSADFVTLCGNLTGFDISADHPGCCVEDGILYSRDMTALLQCFANRTKAVVIPEGVTTIGTQAFYRCEQIPSISFPSTLKRIEDWGCAVTRGVTEPIVLPESLEYLGKRAFQLCGGIRDTFVLPSGVQLAEGVFDTCQEMTTLIIEDGVTELPADTFSFCTGLTQVYMPETIERIGTNCFWFVYDVKIYGTSGTAAEDFVNSEEGRELRAKFYSLKNGYSFSEHEIYLSLLEADDNSTVTITITPDQPSVPITWSSSDKSVAVVDNGLVQAVSAGKTTITASFGSITLQCTVVVHNGVQISTDGKTLIRVSDHYCGDLVIPEGIETIQSNAFYIVSGLTGLSLPSTLKAIGSNALYGVGYTHPIDLIFPDSMQSLAEIAIQNCSLREVRYPVGANVAQSAFSMSSISNLIIPEGVTTLPKYVFEYGNIGSCYLPASLTSAPCNVFEQAFVQTFYGYSSTYAETYVAELQKAYPDQTFTFVSLGTPINHSQYTLMEGETVELVWLENVVWTSSDESVAAVASDGLVTGMKAGTATITATAANGTSASCRIIVRAAGFGDANEDGVADVRDALAILQYTAGWDVPLNPQNADVNEDGIIGPSDALRILMDCMGGNLVSALRALRALADDLSIKLLEITTQPEDQFIQAGGQARFTVTAAGDGLAYQWQINRNDGNGWQLLKNAAGAIHVTAAAGIEADGYQYRCVITDAFGSEIVSDAAVLHVALDMPATGDPAEPALWLIICILSLFGILLLSRTRLRRTD